jgi:hypothetical protein
MPLNPPESCPISKSWLKKPAFYGRAISSQLMLKPINPYFLSYKKGRLKPYINQVSDDLFNLIRQPQNIFFMAF